MHSKNDEIWNERNLKLEKKGWTSWNNIMEETKREKGRKEISGERRREVEELDNDRTYKERWY